MRVMVGLPYSPWTERARWALDHHGIAVEHQAFLPVLGEISLRLKLRQPTGKVTVPVLFAGDEVVRDSLDIVRWADRHRTASKLVPADLEADVLAWNDRAEAIFQAARNLYVARMVEDPELVEQMAPRAIPKPLRASSARVGIALFKKKYALGARDPDVDRGTIESNLDALRAALGGRATILDRFTLADVAMAISLQQVVPVADEFIRITPAARRCSTIADLAERYADLVAWRDATYARHRRSGARAEPVEARAPGRP